MAGREGLLKRMEERLSRVSGWLTERPRGEQAGARDLHELAEALRRGIARARRNVGDAAHADLARARADLEDMKGDYGHPLARYGLNRTELELFRRHLHTTAHLAHDLSTADSPAWSAADEEYERSWEELERVIEPEHDARSP